MSHAVAGVDIGTSAVKGAVFSTCGRRLRGASAEVPVSRPGPHLMEQDADALVRAAVGVLDRLWPFDALALVGQINTHVLVDEGGRAMGPALVWGDRRASESRGPGRANSLRARAGWWRRHQPDRWRRARWVMQPRDYVLLRLSGQAVTDPTSWPDAVADACWRQDLSPGVRRRLPPLAQPYELAGSYQGVPVVTGCMDALAAAIGCGDSRPGTAIDVSGTSETVGLVCSTSSANPSIRGVMALPGGFWHAGPTQGGARVFEWLRLVAPSLDRDAIAGLLAAAPPGPTGIVFVPFVEGERAPIWRPEARGGLLGLGVEHHAGHLVKAMLEGVAFSARHILESVGGACDRGPSVLYICGGSAHIEVWNQVKADVLGIPVAVPRDPDAGVLGAAMLAAAHLTGQPLARVQEVMAGETARVLPSASATAAYAPLYARYLDAVELLADWAGAPLEERSAS